MADAPAKPRPSARGDVGDYALARINGAATAYCTRNLLLQRSTRGDGRRRHRGLFGTFAPVDALDERPLASCIEQINRPRRSGSRRSATNAISTPDDRPALTIRSAGAEGRRSALRESGLPVLREACGRPHRRRSAGARCGPATIASSAGAARAEARRLAGRADGDPAAAPARAVRARGQRPRFLDALFAAASDPGRGAAGRARRAHRAGGYPAALARRRRAGARWYRDYVETQIQRDVRDLTRITRSTRCPGCWRWPRPDRATVNVADLAAPFELTRQTIHDYVTLLERVFLLERLPPWHTNRLSRLVKTPKLTWRTRIAGLLGIDATLHGRTARTLLRLGSRTARQASWRQIPTRFSTS